MVSQPNSASVLMLLSAAPEFPLTKQGFIRGETLVEVHRYEACPKGEGDMSPNVFHILCVHAPGSLPLIVDTAGIGRLVRNDRARRGIGSSRYHVFADGKCHELGSGIWQDMPGLIRAYFNILAEKKRHEAKQTRRRDRV